MAAENVRFAADVLDLMCQRAPKKDDALVQKIGFNEGEAQEWRCAAENIYVLKDDKKTE